MNNNNFFDDTEFFNSYRKLRKRELNYNNLLEQPAISALLPDLTGKTVLDLGCGYGQNCYDFVKRGAKSVIGVDIAEKMLQVARTEYADDKIKYLNMSIEDVTNLNQTFDLIYSSLAFHYVKDFNALAKNTYAMLNDNGTLLFSQEHPINTATHGGKHRYNKNIRGKYKSFTFSNYNEIGKREFTWYIGGLEKYHRNFSAIVNPLLNAGFRLEKVVEPLPTKEATQKWPVLLEKELIKPTFLIIKARKVLK